MPARAEFTPNRRQLFHTVGAAGSCAALLATACRQETSRTHQATKQPLPPVPVRPTETTRVVETPRQTLARNFVQALISGDLPRASSFVTPSDKPRIQEYLVTASSRLRNCVIDRTETGEVEIGRGKLELGVVLFKNRCGPEQQFSSFGVMITEINNQHYITPVVLELAFGR